MRPLELDGPAGEPLPCVLWEGSGAGVAVVFPGGSRAGHRLGGTPARPDLHYARALLLQLGLSVLEVWWDAERVPRAAGPWLDEAAAAALAAARDEGALRCLVGRSFGTCALARLVGRLEHRDVPAVWIAPLLRFEDVRPALQGAAARSFVAGGGADRAWDAAADAAALRTRGAAVAVVEGGDHGLDVGDAAASARALAVVLDELRAWLARRL